MILDVVPPSPPTPPTREEVAAEKVRLLAAMTAASLTQFVESINRGRRLFWENPDGFTPGELAAAAGTSCGELFAKNAATEAFLAEHFPGAASLIWQPPYADYVIVPGGDGSIGITPVPEPEAPAEEPATEPTEPE